MEKHLTNQSGLSWLFQIPYFKNLERPNRSSIPQIQKKVNRQPSTVNTVASRKANERSVLLFTLLSSAWPSHFLLKEWFMGVNFDAFMEPASYPKQQPTVEKVGLRSTFFLQFLSQRPNRQLSHLNLKESSIAEKLRCVLLSKRVFHAKSFFKCKPSKRSVQTFFLFYPSLFPLIVKFTLESQGAFHRWEASLRFVIARSFLQKHFLNAYRRKGLSQRSFFFPFTLSSHRLIHIWISRGLPSLRSFAAFRNRKIFSSKSFFKCKPSKGQ